MAKGNPFATFLIIGSTCFFLGILFASFPYDYYVIWSTPPTTPPPLPFGTVSTFPPSTSLTNITELRAPYIALLEHHLKILHAAPPLISRILHITMATGLLALISKLYKPTEANMLFDGASLVLYMCGVVVYVSNIVKGMRVVTANAYGLAERMAAERHASSMASVAGLDPSEAGPIPGSAGSSRPDLLVMSREESLKVLAASNTILAVVLIGVLILQAGQWYAHKKEAAEIESFEKEAREASPGRSLSGRRRGSGNKSTSPPPLPEVIVEESTATGVETSQGAKRRG